MEKEELGKTKPDREAFEEAGGIMGREGSHRHYLLEGLLAKEGEASLVTTSTNFTQGHFLLGHKVNQRNYEVASGQTRLKRGERVLSRREAFQA